MARLDSSHQHTLCDAAEHNATYSDNEDEFDLLIDALSSIDNKLNSIDINTRQCEDELHTVVRPCGEAVIVHLQISISSIEDIDTVRQEFTCEFYLGVRWEEPQLKDEVKEGRKIEWEKCWDPRISFQNAVEITNITSSTKLIRPLYDGNPSVQISYRVKGKFKTLFNLRSFPFDKQRLQIRIVSKWSDSVVQFKEASYKPGHLNCKTFLCEHEWSLYKHVIGTESCTADDCSDDHSIVLQPSNKTSDAHCNHRVASINPPNTPPQKGIMKKPLKDERPLTFSVFTFSFSIRRKFSFFVSNVIVLLALISFLALGPFCVAQTEIGDRLSIIFTLLLTAVTFKFVVSQSLPRVSYQTLLDQYVLVCIIYIFVMSIIIGVTTKIKFLQTHEPFTVLVSGALWLLILSWIIFSSVVAVQSSKFEMQRLENVFHSRSTKSTIFQHLANTKIKDIILPKLSPDAVPLRISESTASTVPQLSLSNTIIGRAKSLVQNRERANERRSTLAKIRIKKKNLKLRQGKKKSKKAKAASVILDESKGKTGPGISKRKSNTSSSSSSSSEAFESNEIVLGRYTASLGDEDDSSESGEVFTIAMSAKEQPENIEMQSKNATAKRSLTIQG